MAVIKKRDIFDDFVKHQLNKQRAEKNKKILRRHKISKLQKILELIKQEGEEHIETFIKDIQEYCKTYGTCTEISKLRSEYVDWLVEKNTKQSNQNSKYFF